MANAAIYLHPDGFDTSAKRLLGRHSAGESFLRGFVRHADVDRFYFWNSAGKPQASLDALVARIEAPARPIQWISQMARPQLEAPGVLHIPAPDIAAEAWRRRPYGARRYAISGITHTTASAAVMRMLPELLIAPLEDYDALICTSTAVRSAVETQLGLMREYMGAAYGPRRRPEPQRVTIPLGVNCADFSTSPEHRKAWRERLAIPEDALVVLYVGRFHVRAKMNPALMAMALERAARRTGQTIYWVNSGWAENEQEAEEYHVETRKLCPSVRYLTVDGRPPDVRFSIWSVADLFLSFSDNIQETFGLTPVEAMAAGLPSVVSDWDGYKDTVRDGLDGFRIPTILPRPQYGVDLAYWYNNNWMSYDHYTGAVGQYAAIDLGAAERALVALLTDGDLRRKMGAQAQAQARTVFDWSAIIPQYQALWGEQDARRRAAAAQAPSSINPFAPDPFTLFASYPTRHLALEDMVELNPELNRPAALARLEAPLAAYSRVNRISPAEVEAVLDHLAGQGPSTVSALRELVPEIRRNYLERGLIWLARHDVVAIRAAA